MKLKEYISKFLLTACAVCCFAFAALADNPPFFTTDIKVNDKGELLLTEKGVKRVDVFSEDGKLQRSYPMAEAPTGILLDGDKAYVTTFENGVGKLQTLSLTSGEVTGTVVTGSGACYPMFSPDKKSVCVCNQFSATVTEVDPAAQKVLRTAKVLREPKSAVFSKDGKYLYVANFLPSQRADVDLSLIHI